MELIDSLQKIIGNYMSNAALTDLVIGTVSKIGPLEVTLTGSMLPLPAEVLLLTQGVVEKVIIVNGHTHDINVLGHTHTFSDNTGQGSVEGTTRESLTGSYTSLLSMENLVCIEHGVPQPVEGNRVTVNRGLAVGDRVVMLRVLGGQKFIILSRVFQ